jgi:hypothetical protein
VHTPQPQAPAEQLPPQAQAPAEQLPLQAQAPAEQLQIPAPLGQAQVVWTPELPYMYARLAAEAEAILRGEEGPECKFLGPGPKR